jgi:hypothetical protein
MIARSAGHTISSLILRKRSVSTHVGIGILYIYIYHGLELATFKGAGSCEVGTWYISRTDGIDGIEVV